MTATPVPNGEHPEVTEISALSEGILAAERQESLRAHLTECALCADVHASLEEIRETLGALPGPARMPEDVASRIDAALAAEAILSATPLGENESASPDNAVSRETARNPAEPSEEPARATTPAPVSRETATATIPVNPRRRKRTIVLVVAASMAALTLGGITVRALSNPAPTETASGTAKSETGKKQVPDAPPNSTAPTDTDAGGSSDDQRLRKRVQHLLSGQQSSSPSRKAPGGSAQPSDSPSIDTKQSPSSDGNTLRDDGMGAGEGVPSCVRDGIHRSETPLAVDADATFENRSGYLVVLPHQGGNPRLVDAYLVDPSCVSADPSGPGKVLFKGTYPRG
ncbi:hypothetical protein ITI46_27865 [Streptomyces oryzae]|uniref:Zinc-finger domain-containing protein n=1 Tax=Streptomyces oryzae TaxID=1434886 RepID=A0ABS3XJF5_9ACTN|nr:hypothetical protein [Streptomyces oryzae]MBO8195436.1 hypothetical protein [Streptomyces oryzae]